MTAPASPVLVTGGCGFIGSHLCDRLVAEGRDVFCIDNLLTGDARNVAHLQASPRFAWREHDITEPLAAADDFAAGEIYNLACPASPLHYRRHAVETARTAGLGALNMLARARHHGAKILQASTSEVYGDPEKHPQREDYWGHVNPIGPRACYNEGKRYAETLFVHYRAQYGLRTKIARLFNVYGPRMQAGDGRVVSNFIVQALRGEPITIQGDGTQTRAFCYVDDMVDGLLALMAAADTLSDPVNLGNPVEISVLALAETVRSLTRSSSPIVFAPAAIDDPRRRCPDIARARSQLGWEPKVTLEDGLRRTIAWFETQLES